MSKTEIILALLIVLVVSAGCAGKLPFDSCSTAIGIGAAGTTPMNPSFGAIGGAAAGSMADYYDQSKKDRWKNFSIYPLWVYSGSCE